jgi:hypothetical protein
MAAGGLTWTLPVSGPSPRLRFICEGARIVAEDLLDQSGPEHGSPPHPATEILTLAELHPTVPLRTIIGAVRHAEGSVPLGADRRAEAVAELIAARLEGVAPNR